MLQIGLIEGVQLAQSARETAPKALGDEIVQIVKMVLRGDAFKTQKCIDRTIFDGVPAVDYCSTWRKFKRC